MGNSIVSGIQRSEAEKNNRNRYIEAMGQKLTADTARKIDGQLATDLNNSLNNTMQGVDASVDRMLWAINRNNAIDAQESFATEDAANLARRNQVVTSTNAYSDLTQANIQTVSYQHELNKYNRALNTQAYGEQVRARYQRGNQMAAGEFSKFKLTGTDFSKAYDWDEAIAFQDAAWTDGRHRQNEFNNFSILPNEGGFTYAKGVQIIGDAIVGGGAYTPKGEFFSWDFKNKELNVGHFWSIQGGPDIGLRPAGSIDIVFDQTLFFDSGEFDRSLRGTFITEGGEAAFGLHLGGEAVQALQGDNSRHVEGVGFTIGGGTPDISGHINFGYGNIIGDPKTIKFGDVPEYFFHRWTNGVFK